MLVSKAILTDGMEYLDAFGIQLDSFRGISDSVTILFKLDIGLQITNQHENRTETTYNLGGMTCALLQ